jgi:hypothetical protein
MELGRSQIPDDKRFHSIQLNIQKLHNITEISRSIPCVVFTNELQMVRLVLKTIPMLE